MRTVRGLVFIVEESFLENCFGSDPQSPRLYDHERINKIPMPFSHMILIQIPITKCNEKEIFLRNGKYKY